MISVNSPNNSQQSNTGSILVNRHITVQATAEFTGYNIQYLGRSYMTGVEKWLYLLVIHLVMLKYREG